MSRTTISLDPDVVAAVDRIRADTRQGLSETVNALVRRGLAVPPPAATYRYTPPHVRLGLTVDPVNIGEVLELLDED